jgi:hypothetical protein
MIHSGPGAKPGPLFARTPLKSTKGLTMTNGTRTTRTSFSLGQIVSARVRPNIC